MVRVKLGLIDLLKRTPPNVPLDTLAITPAPSDEALVGCIILTEPQVDVILNQSWDRRRDFNNRVKRDTILMKALEKHYPEQ